MSTLEKVQNALDRRAEGDPDEIAEELSRALGRRVGLSEVVSPTAADDLLAEASGEKSPTQGRPGWLDEGQASPL